MNRSMETDSRTGMNVFRLFRQLPGFYNSDAGGGCLYPHLRLQGDEVGGKGSYVTFQGLDLILKSIGGY